MVKGEETILADVKTAHDEELKIKEKEDIETLQRLLRQLFQLQADDQLNYGIYRIMNEKRSEVEKFINQTLPDQVRDACTDLTPEIARQHRSFIFSHIHSFFSRYYEKGDFMPLRRYSAQQKYAIPYNGEEVLLHWANKDQYYIKTGEFFANTAFRVGEYTIRFRTVQAETVQDNVQAADRYFLLVDSGREDEYDDEKKELTIELVFRALTSDEQKRYGTRNLQKKINEEITDTVLCGLSEYTLKEVLMPKKDDIGVFARHLATYTHKNTTDFFIHKDLGGFLTRELDFYIKNEVFHLDDLGSGTEVPVQVYVSRARIIKKIGEDVIAFLAQIEEFQKRLFEKKKFVLGCNYCLTLDRVPCEFWPEILQNTEQVAEWEKLYGIGSSEQQSLFSGYDTGFLEAHPYLMIDTKFFDEGFVDRLLGGFEDLDDTTGGLMIHSENFQALNLLQERYRESVKCVYIDPPYNTDAAPIVYKNNYKKSSWNSLIFDRVYITQNLLSSNGIFCGTIDDVQQKEFHSIIEQIFGLNSILGTVVIRNNPSGRPIPAGFAIAHEYAIFASNKVDVKIDKLPREEKHNSRYKENDEKGSYMWELLRKRGSNSKKEDAPKSYFPFFVRNGVLRLPNMNWNEDKDLWVMGETPADNEISVYPIDENGVERNWRWGIETAKTNIAELKYVEKNGSITIYYKFYQPEGITPTTNWIDSKYSATEHGTGVVKHFFDNYQPFSYPKSIYAVIDCIDVAGVQKEEKSLCLDFFAGSGTTAHAVLSLNKEDQGSRKYILVEMADYFDTVMKPRIQKVCYSANWKEGLPQDTDGQSHIFKYFSMESYEDSLNNITFDTSVQKTLTDLDGYFLNYLLDFETRSSPCRLAIDQLKHPFDYQIKVIRDQTGQRVTVDLPETFAYLIGLHVKIRKAYSSGPAPRYLLYHGSTREGTVTVIWRDCEKIDLTKDKEYVTGTILRDIPKADLLYMNGEFIVPGAHGLERVFKERMGA